MNFYIRIVSIALLLSGCVYERDYSEVLDISQLKNTSFVPTLEQAIDKGKNQIYCSTLLFAWNEIREESSSNIEIRKATEQLIFINESTLFRNSLSENEINNQVAIEDDLISAKSEFSKSLPFIFHFERNNKNLRFGANLVESFGFNGSSPELASQVEVLFYCSEKEFAIRLKPKAEDQEVLLYLPSKTSGSFEKLLRKLNQSIKTFSKSRSAEKDYWRYYFSEQDTLSIPILNFNLEKNYNTLVGSKVAINGKEFTVQEVNQQIALVLDHKGAEVQSEAEIGLVTGEIADLPKSKRIIFDKPFLVVFKKKSSVNPYLVAWITNAELMNKK
ncbi:hypothetical protein [Rufibacter hautae]|uniref:Serpin domain-containing protein n=1 Tax=Rufibacter hautae TaxID=2595005 RepID=A0A5B6TES5_9BACT|nr:hypothetical protein [Rufibacter hautae]KAA3437795.1 hypothetical protein FOA19_10910 [Rufibacter hautae]